MEPAERRIEWERGIGPQGSVGVGERVTGGHEAGSCVYCTEWSLAEGDETRSAPGEVPRRFSVDVQELARTGSINGQALWGVRVRESAKLPNAKAPNERGSEGAARESAPTPAAERLHASMSAIRVWDAGEIAREMRGGHAGSA